MTTAAIKRKIHLPTLWESIEYAPHSGQKPVHAARFKDRKRFRVVCAGRRTGKSFLGGHELTLEYFKALARLHMLEPKGKRAEFWIIGPEYSDGEKEFRVVWNDLTKLGVEMDHPGSYYNAESGQMDISCFGGRFQIHVKSAKYPDSLVGEGLEGVILAEAAKLKPSVWTKYVRPMLADYKGWALMTSTPEGKNWFYDAYMLGQQEQQGWWSVRMPSWINDRVFPDGREDEEITGLLLALGQELFNQEIGALFTEFTGRVFKEFDEEIHTKPLEYNPSPSWETVAAVDYGFTNPNVWLLIQIDPWDNVYVLDEYYESHKTAEEFAADVLARGLRPAKLRTFYPDPASPGDTRTMEQKLRIRAAGGTGGELNTRLNLIRRWLKTGPTYLDVGHENRVPKLFIDSAKCPNLVREMNDYRYPGTKEEAKRNETEMPMKKDDHAPEALGRMFASRFASQIESGRTRISTANMA